jgi:argininosuccinate synthase
MSRSRVVLAYSGGLDTAVILHWLTTQGFDVYTFTADLGQDQDFDQLRADATAAGATETIVEDVRGEFLEDYVLPVLRSGAIYQDRYLLGTPMARPLVAHRQVHLAHRLGATHVAHGATGKGTDQLRFELVYGALDPSLHIVAPWKEDRFLALMDGRGAALAYAAQHGIPIRQFDGPAWSIDENLVHTSYEGDDLEDPAAQPRPDMFRRTVDPRQAPDSETIVELRFDHGDLVAARDLTEGHDTAGPLEAYGLVEEAAARNGVGRIDFVEDRAIGIKSRNAYEAPGATVIHLAHRELEQLTVDVEVLRLRDSLLPEFATRIYRGLWFAPEVELLRVFFDATQTYVSGEVRVSLFKGHAAVLSRRSDHALLDPDLASMDRGGSLDPRDATGYIRLTGLRLRSAAMREPIRERRDADPASVDVS